MVIFFLHPEYFFEVYFPPWEGNGFVGFMVESFGRFMVGMVVSGLNRFFHSVPLLLVSHVL